MSDHEKMRREAWIQFAAVSQLRGFKIFEASGQEADRMLAEFDKRFSEKK